MFLFLSHTYVGLTSIPRNIPPDTRMIDLQNNKIKEVKENDLRGLTSLYVSLLFPKFENLVSSLKYLDTLKIQMVFPSPII